MLHFVWELRVIFPGKMRATLPPNEFLKFNAVSRLQVLTIRIKTINIVTNAICIDIIYIMTCKRFGDVWAISIF